MNTNNILQACYLLDETTRILHEKSDFVVKPEAMDTFFKAIINLQTVSLLIRQEASKE